MNKAQNKQVSNTKDQINNTIIYLRAIGICVDYKKAIVEPLDRNCAVTWPNYHSGRYNCGSNFISLDQYASIVDTGAYQCLLYDGSLIRASFVFSKNKLIQENLLFWPSPFDIDIGDIETESAKDIVMAQTDWFGKLKMRTPIRLDYDSLHVASEEHPTTHMHLQHPDCRIEVNAPCCFNTFIHFIFNNFYPNLIKDIKKEASSHPLFGIC